MTGRIEGRVAVVVGAAAGIGKAVAQRFREEGARLVLADIDDMIRSTANELGSAAAVALAVVLHGRLDIVVQNAGIYPWQLIEHTSPEDGDRVMGVNLRGCFNIARAALAPMKARGAGHVFFTSSITGPHVTSPGHGHYSASKAGINGFIRAAALEFSAYGININGVEPGNILTEAVQLHRSTAFPEGKDFRILLP